MNEININEYQIDKLIKSDTYIQRFEAIHQPTNKKVSLFLINPTKDKSIKKSIEVYNFFTLQNYPGTVKILGLRQYTNESDKCQLEYSKKEGRNKKVICNGPVLITELLDSKSVEDYVHDYLKSNGKIKDHMNPTIRSKIIFGVASILKQFHRNNLILRDLEISNIFLNEKFEPIFGFTYFAQKIERDSEPTVSLGTPLYMAPELLTDEQLDFPIDVYSFAFFLYKMFTNDRLILNNGKTARNAQQYMMNMQMGFRPKMPDQISPQFENLISMCWRANPSERPTFEEIVSILRNDEFALEEFGMKTDLDDLHEYQGRIDFDIEIQKSDKKVENSKDKKTQRKKPKKIETNKIDGDGENLTKKKPKKIDTNKIDDDGENLTKKKTKKIETKKIDDYGENLTKKKTKKIDVDGENLTKEKTKKIDVDGENLTKEKTKKINDDDYEKNDSDKNVSDGERNRPKLSLLPKEIFEKPNSKIVQSLWLLQNQPASNSIISDEEERYHRIVSEISNGSNFINYKVFDKRSNSLMMKKVIILNHSQEESLKEFKRYLASFEINKKFCHPCICSAICMNFSEKLSVSTEKAISIFYEYNEYELIKCLQKKILNNTMKTRIIVELAHAMNYVHKQSVIHRDLKIENIRLNAIYEAKLTGFDFACLFNLKDIDSCVSDEIYMSPELAAKKNYDYKTDVYSFGIILYRIFVGNLPKQDLNDKINGKKIDIKGPSDSISKFCIILIKKCTAFKPDDRPSFSEIIEELRRNDYSLAEEIDKSVIYHRDHELELFESNQ